MVHVMGGEMSTGKGGGRRWVEQTSEKARKGEVVRKGIVNNARQTRVGATGEAPCRLPGSYLRQGLCEGWQGKSCERGGRRGAKRR